MKRYASLGLLFFLLVACMTERPTVTLDLVDGAILTGGDFDSVFKFDRTEPISAPAANTGVFDFLLKIDSEPTGVRFDDLGGSLHGSSGSMESGQLRSLLLVLNNERLQPRLRTIARLRTALEANGFEPMIYDPATVSVPEMDLTLLAPDIVEVKLEDEDFGAALIEGLNNQSNDLSRRGVTAFSLRRGPLRVSCRMIGNRTPGSPARTGDHIVWTECLFADIG